MAVSRGNAKVSVRFKISFDSESLYRNDDDGRDGLRTSGLEALYNMNNHLYARVMDEINFVCTI